MPVLNQAAARLGQSLKETEDELMRSLLESTASFVNSTGGTNGDNPTEPTANSFETVVSTLQTANADFIGDVIEGKVFALVKSLVIDLEILEAA